MPDGLREAAFWLMVFITAIVDLLAIMAGFTAYAYYGTTKTMLEALLGTIMNMTFLAWVYFGEHVRT